MFEILASVLLYAYFVTKLKYNSLNTIKLLTKMKKKGGEIEIGKIVFEKQI